MDTICICCVMGAVMLQYYYLLCGILCHLYFEILKRHRSDCSCRGILYSLRIYCK